MKQKITCILTAAWLLCAAAAVAQSGDSPAVQQKKNGCGCRFSSIFSAGVLSGKAGDKFQIQTVQGIRLGKWFAGIGTGLDYYHIRGIPLFLDIRRDLLNQPNTPFIYADGGVHFAWATEESKATTWTKSEFKNGLYYDVGLGYKIRAGKQGGVLLSAGYSHKYVKEKQISSICGWGVCNEQRELFRYKLNRVSLKLGIQL